MSNILTNSEIIALWLFEGGTISSAQTALAHALSESSGSPTVTSSNPDGGTNVGIYQLDTRGVGSGYTEAQLKDPFTNTRITVDATKNGKDWSDWADNYTAFWGKAGQAVQAFTKSANGNNAAYAKTLTGSISGSDKGVNDSGTSAQGASLTSLIGDAGSAISEFSTIADVANTLMQPSFWMRVGAFFAGMAFLGLGLWTLIKSLDPDIHLPSIAPVPVP